MCGGLSLNKLLNLNLISVFWVCKCHPLVPCYIELHEALISRVFQYQNQLLYFKQSFGNIGRSLHHMKTSNKVLTVRYLNTLKKQEQLKGSQNTESPFKAVW